MASFFLAGVWRSLFPLMAAMIKDAYGTSIRRFIECRFVGTGHHCQFVVDEADRRTTKASRSNQFYAHEFAHIIVDFRFIFPNIMQLERFTFGVGDRFAHQAAAQLRAFLRLAEQGIDVIPVWNKSNREHSFIGSEPSAVRAAAMQPFTKSNWSTTLACRCRSHSA